MPTSGARGPRLQDEARAYVEDAPTVAHTDVDTPVLEDTCRSGEERDDVEPGSSLVKDALRRAPESAMPRAGSASFGARL